MCRCERLGPALAVFTQAKQVRAQEAPLRRPCSQAWIGAEKPQRVLELGTGQVAGNSVVGSACVHVCVGTHAHAHALPASGLIPSQAIGPLESKAGFLITMKFAKACTAWGQSRGLLSTEAESQLAERLEGMPRSLLSLLPQAWLQTWASRPSCISQKPPLGCHERDVRAVVWNWRVAEMGAPRG